MTGSDFNKVINLGNVLRSRTCLTILGHLTKGDASNQEIFDKIKEKANILYRTSIFEALKRILKAELIEKYYDTHAQKIKYKLKATQISINFEHFKD